MTRKIGRYEILGPLATGGMAEILLARLVGPSGFERPVVIKRIRQDLDHEELEDLFLQEARLAAKIRHANVVAVEDLGRDDGAPYLVMEYLEGESLSNVTRRLKTHEETLPFGLIAYVVSEACAGLHAAHELRDQDDVPLGIVHRDVSPQNVFVTYDGAIKVVDFGIARSQGSPRSAPGEVRGKIGYMSPEQLRGDALDRRTDVFALGIVLYECLTEHRLFKRFNAMGTLRAVLTDPILPPRRIDPKIPAALDAICMRALSRAREERYATAAEMRRELLVAMRDLVSEEPSAELAELMVRSFADRIEDKKVLLGNVREGSVVDHIPVGDIDVTIEFPGLEDVPTGAEWGPPSARGSQPSLVTKAPASIPDGASDVTRLERPLREAETGPRASAPLASPRGAAAIDDDLAVSAPRRRRWPLLVAALLVVGGVAFGVRFARGHGLLASRAPAGTASETMGTASSAVSAASAARPEPGAIAVATASSATTAGNGTAVATATTATPSGAPPPSGNRRPPRAALTVTSAATSTATAPTPPPPDTTAAPSSSARGFRRFQ